MPWDEALDGAPPLASKTHPRNDVDDCVPTLDDEHRREHRHPGEAAALSFSIDPETGDAAADLASELGAQVVEGATRGEDLSDRVVASELEIDASEMIIEDELGEADEIDDAPTSAVRPRFDARDDDDDGDG